MITNGFMIAMLSLKSIHEPNEFHFEKKVNRKINLKPIPLENDFREIHGVNVNSNILTFETVFPWPSEQGKTAPTKRGGKRNEKKNHLKHKNIFGIISQSPPECL